MVEVQAIWLIILGAIIIFDGVMWWLKCWLHNKTRADRARWRSAAETSMADVRRLAKERDWLAAELRGHCIHNPPGTDGDDYWAWEGKMTREQKVGLWLKAARDAVAGEGGVNDEI